MTTMNTAIEQFLLQFDETADLEPTIVEFLTEQLEGLLALSKTSSAFSPNEELLFLLNECLSGVVSEFEEMNPIQQNQISSNLLQQIKPTQTSKQQKKQPPQDQQPQQQPTPSPPPPPANPPPPPPSTTVQPLRGSRRKRHNQTNNSNHHSQPKPNIKQPSSHNNFPTSDTANATPTAVATHFFSQHGGSLDPSTLTYLLALLNENATSTTTSNENDFSCALPFIYAHAPDLNPDQHQQECHHFLQQLKHSLVQENVRLSRQQQTEKQRKRTNNSCLPENLQSTTIDAATAAYYNYSASSSGTVVAPLSASPSMLLLSETFPDASMALLDWILNVKFFGDLQNASLYLIDNCQNDEDLSKLETKRMDVVEKEKRTAVKEARERQKLAAAERQHLLNRYTQEHVLPSQQTGCRPVPNTHDGRRLVSKKKSDAAKRRGKGETEVRYVDGVQIRVKKGQKKIVVESTKEEWNGGSKGRVVRKSQAFNARR